MKIKHILIDLDKTLLDIDFDNFLKAYFLLLIPKLKKILLDKDPLKILKLSVDYMIEEKNGRLNVDKFYDKFVELSEIEREKLEEVFLEFYKNDFPKLSNFGKPTKNGRETLLELLESNFKIVIATNSIFPKIAILERMKWAGIQDLDFELITTMENMHYAKPNSEYYLEILDKIGARKEEVVMIGDDYNMDIEPAKKL